uniref:Uncharacterized protein n=1 Tax=Steinernema glaseri TaxID=37863 RepID=A0A1I7ZER8_9BILA
MGRASPPLIAPGRAATAVYYGRIGLANTERGLGRTRGAEGAHVCLLIFWPAAGTLQVTPQTIYSQQREDQIISLQAVAGIRSWEK